MPLTRIYHPDEIELNTEINLTPKATHHLSTVLRSKIGENIILFNNTGDDYFGEISFISKKSIKIKINQKKTNNTESNLHIHLYQGIARGEKMDLIIQKSIELGIKEITPIFTNRSGVKLTPERLTKKLSHWSGIIESACEQSGRAMVPKLNKPIDINQINSQNLTLILSPTAKQNLKNIAKRENQKINLIIGPEGGLTDLEIENLKNKDFIDITLGPRILRTETAGLAIISVLQGLWGDF